MLDNSGSLAELESEVKRLYHRAEHICGEKKKKILIITFTALAFVFVSIFGLYCYFKVLYPMKHQALIAKYAQEYDLDPYFVSAVIWKESRFREDAVSSAGAVGLMQVMPETGGWISEKIGLEGYDATRLKEPEYNIRLGCWYLSYLEDKFGGDVTKSLQAITPGRTGSIAGWRTRNTRATELR